jgi:hypothetical protein
VYVRIATFRKNLRADSALVAVAGIVHDIDLKDARYQPKKFPEWSG